MLLYEKEGKLNLDFAKFPLTTPDVSVVKSGIAVSVKLNGVDVLTGTSEAITVSVESGATGVTVGTDGTITSTVSPVVLKVTTETEGITLKYAFGDSELAEVPEGGSISKTYDADASDTLTVKGIAINGTTYTGNFTITVDLP